MEGPNIYQEVGDEDEYKGLPGDSIRCAAHLLNLAVPGTSVPSERVASVAGNIVSYKRTRLAADFVERLTLGSMNWEFVQDFNLEAVTDVEVPEEVDSVFFLDY